MSTSPNLLMDLQNTGDNTGTWGTITNDNLSIIDNRMGGRQAKSVASSNITLSDAEAENVFQRITGTLGANIDYIFPASSGGFYLISNEATGAFNITVKPSGGTGVTVPQGAMTLVFINPSQTTALKINVISAAAANTFTALQTFSAGAVISSLSLGTPLTVANGGTGAATLTGLLQGNGTGAVTGGATINNSNWSGTDLSVANGGTGASTLTGILLGNGTSAITGTGSTTLGVANGGTGATTLTGLLSGNGTGAITGGATINNGNWSGTDLAVVNGGTGASDAATAARTLLNGLGTTKGNILYYNGTQWTVLAPP